MCTGYCHRLVATFSNCGVHHHLRQYNEDTRAKYNETGLGRGEAFRKTGKIFPAQALEPVWNRKQVGNCFACEHLERDVKHRMWMHVTEVRLETDDIFPEIISGAAGMQAITRSGMRLSPTSQW